MKKYSILGVVLGLFIILGYSFGHAGMDMGHDHSMHGGHEESAATDGEYFKTVNQSGLVFSFKLIDLKEKMMHAGMEEMDMGGKTHHLMVFVGNEGKSTKITNADVKFKILSPSEKTSETMAMAMSGGYGADVDLSEKGEYKIACMVKTGKTKELVMFKHNME